MIMGAMLGCSDLSGRRRAGDPDGASPSALRNVMRAAAKATMPREVRPGEPYPLGATPRDGGVNFALFSQHGEGADLCLYASPADAKPAEIVPLAARTDGVFHCWLAGVRPGQAYGYRVRGPWDLAAGHRFDPCKVLLDPYARAIGRIPRWGPECYSYRAPNFPAPELADQIRSDLSNAASSPLGIVAAASDGNFDHPRRGWSETVLYELHVRGFTKRHPLVPPELRGTYAGLGSEPVVRHLTELGVTAVELLPVQHHLDDHRLARMGLRNYWGYQPLGFMAPEPTYAAAGGAGAIREFRAMVRSLHAAGIEVILDVVFNHSAELGHDGPTFSLRGIDNRSYYQLRNHDRARYVNHSGCGNSLDAGNPAVVRLVMDSLRHWVSAMGIDGFRFDLAASLGRARDTFDPRAALLAAIVQDPVLDGAKLIAEPWDLHPCDGYQQGNFPARWAEWNGRFRDDVRRFWRGDRGLSGAFATRVAGSSDVFGARGRSPLASVNFVTAHDGFTLADLVSYTAKRNDANGEGGRDGESNNNSWNCGHEGPCADRSVLELRQRQRRNLLATLFLSQGVPMVLAGDEFGRTQFANNNAYCQDSEVSWVDWAVGEADDLRRFVRLLARIRRSSPAFRRDRFFDGRLAAAGRQGDIEWLSADGSPLEGSDWTHEGAGCFGARMEGGGESGYLLLFNSCPRTRAFELPTGGWTIELDTAEMTRRGRRAPLGGYRLAPSSMAVLRSVGE